MPICKAKVVSSVIFAKSSFREVICVTSMQTNPAYFGEFMHFIQPSLHSAILQKHWPFDN